MKGVTFGDIHTSTFGIYLSSVAIGEAVLKKFQLDIPGASGSLDLTDYFGSVSYENRLLKFEFTFPQRNAALLSVYSDFLNAIHGKKLKIILDDDSEHHYVGRVSVGELKKDVVSTVYVECDCEPFRYSNTPNLIEITVNDVEFPTDWLYGDVNGNGNVSSTDLTAVKAMAGKKSYESEAALRADFDFDGTVTESDANALEHYLNNGSKLSFKEYVSLNPSLLEMKNCKRKVIDFGKANVDVTFSVKSITNTKLWEVRVDNIPLSGHIHSYEKYTAQLSGKHEIMIVTANTNTTGVFEVMWDSAGQL